MFKFFKFLKAFRKAKFDFSGMFDSLAHDDD